jgi:hypothetical protein
MGGVVDYQHKLTGKIGDAINRQSRYHSSPFDVFLDHLMHYLMIEPMQKEVCPHMTHIVAEAMTVWGDQMDDQGRTWYDMLGWLYEYIASNYKRKGMGQFFTPPYLCDMMVRINNPVICERTNKNNVITGPTTIQDPACGSGRMLLAAASSWINAQQEEDYRYVDGFYMCANDLDAMCTKMTAINFVLHGLTGEVTCANGLWMEDDYRFGYQIETIPIWKYCMKMYNTLAKQVERGDSYEELDYFLNSMGGDKRAAIFELRTLAEACRLGKHYDSCLQMVKNKIHYYICYSDIDGKATYHSPPG